MNNHIVDTFSSGAIIWSAHHGVASAVRFKMMLCWLPIMAAAIEGNFTRLKAISVIAYGLAYICVSLLKYAHALNGLAPHVTSRTRLLGPPSKVWW